ncbi:hypothetical protein ACWEU6_12720 [Streptosporangium sandarakinum]|uniref:hypothetical protein n=1 Tax=Streptosporangium sandarakinum TaxID=1260955 RepID=UPI0036A7B81F
MRAIHHQANREDPSLGVVITSAGLSAGPKTILPVEAALGYSVSQHLFLGAGPLLAVEGSSDSIFLMRMPDYLISQGRIGLDPRLAIIPVGGIGNCRPSSPSWDADCPSARSSTEPRPPRPSLPGEEEDRHDNPRALGAVVAVGLQRPTGVLHDLRLGAAGVGEADGFRLRLLVGAILPGQARG